MQVSITVNGEQRTDEVEPRLLLAHYLREVCGLKATNIGCDSTSCGACTVVVDGLTVKSCTVLAAQTDGGQVTTLEGLAGPDGELHPMQAAFRAEHGLQCGFCTPGFLMLFAGALEHDPRLDHDERRLEETLASNLCRCTGYVNIRRAVLRAARELRGEAPPGE
jgi:aerobic carbon-monoxide dehydrogenase small subunit